MRQDLDEAAEAELTHELEERGFRGEREVFIHLRHRLTEARNNIVPWLSQFLEWPNARVLEIGAGTGSSVVAFAERCRHIDALDILDSHLDVARARARLHGLDNVNFYCRNATDDLAEITSEPYHLIIFAAALEHMTYAERIASLRMAWRHLSSGGILCIYETPNRLWFNDAHTSGLNFYHWLPDQVAIDYARTSSRDGFNSTALTDTDLYRWGRGASFHEIEIALGGKSYDTLESLHEFLCKTHPDYALRSETELSRRYRSILHEIAPGLPNAFTEEMLNIALRSR